eukprot:m.43901 g.43901  ORF g.43901 m.43901 type:complete len:119 (-) comp6459_c0_seq1:735-1091(-)
MEPYGALCSVFLVYASRPYTWPIRYLLDEDAITPELAGQMHCAVMIHMNTMNAATSSNQRKTYVHDAAWCVTVANIEHADEEAMRVGQLHGQTCQAMSSPATSGIHPVACNTHWCRIT